MTRGATIKRTTPERLSLSRPMITRRYELAVEHGKCCGCKLCVLVCPREAMKLTAHTLSEGRLTTRPQIDIDPKLCSFCGECVVICPTHALSMTINGQPEIPVVKGEAFPLLIRTNKLDDAIVLATTDTSYVERCPVGAISAEVERDAQGAALAVKQVKVDKRACINCTRCMVQGPRGAFTVVKPYAGRTFLQVALCPPGCQACADVCPTRCITYDGKRVALDQRFCLFCGACENVCPAPGAVRIVRSSLKHTPIQSAAWATALSKLVSYAEAAREYDVKGQAKRRQAVVKGLRVKETVGDEE